ncbi:peptide ABC transporter substrate-binding protein [Serinicoccus chungangensis]|uniref:Peptide ABC transporter substrate-binding protein n=1 Tax=Serinicoccus chungangensis TaxID=767452 RepID=A0A0W8IHK7_9MICO|nr:ABC transporter substrate-binding protein [Serinicoccus chungangensis]KUG59413.1 peptide ABC transporter substrate-binding protein [Serinicoccus chungangensis]
MKNRRVAIAATSAALALVLSSCAESERDDSSGEGDGASGSEEAGGAEGSDATFVFGAAGAPTTFDPFYASDGETFRVTRQIFQNLVGIEPGGTEFVPELATEWESSEDGLTWTFQLQDGVTFHDGEPFDAEAVCYNFERWADQNEAGQNPSAAYYYGNDFGFGEDSLYESCTATDEMTAEVVLTRATGKFPGVLSQSSYGISSPAALEEYDANGIEVQGEGFTFPEYATDHPTGTGPFVFDSFDGTSNVTLTRNDDFWGEQAGVQEIIFRIISDETARRQELESGTINGYDLPNPVDWAGLEEAGNQVLIRDPFNILYLALNPVADPQLEDPLIRRALYHAINREELVASQLPDGAEVATQFIPPTVAGYNESIEPYAYDPEAAQDLLEEAGASDLTIDLWYPTEVTRPYMPNPQAIYDAVAADWEAVGVTINPVARPWAGGYIDGTQQSQAPAFFLGWTGDLNSADNFLCAFFCGEDNQFGTGALPFQDELQEGLRAGDAEPDEDARTALYEELNAQIMSEEWLPGLPLSHSPPAIVVGPNVEGLVPSPLTAEDFSTITLSE